MSINTLKSFIVNHSKQGKQGNFCLWRLQNEKIDRFCRFWRKSFRKLGQSDSNLCSSWKHISIENIHKFESLIFIWDIIFSSEVVPWNKYLLLKLEFFRLWRAPKIIFQRFKISAVVFPSFRLRNSTRPVLVLERAKVVPNYLHTIPLFKYQKCRTVNWPASMPLSSSLMMMLLSQ